MWTTTCTSTTDRLPRSRPRKWPISTSPHKQQQQHQCDWKTTTKRTTTLTISMTRTTKTKCTSAAAATKCNNIIIIINSIINNIINNNSNSNHNNNKTTTPTVAMAAMVAKAETTSQWQESLRDDVCLHIQRLDFSDFMHIEFGNPNATQKGWVWVFVWEGRNKTKPPHATNRGHKTVLPKDSGIAFALCLCDSLCLPIANYLVKFGLRCLWNVRTAKILRFRCAKITSGFTREVALHLCEEKRKSRTLSHFDILIVHAYHLKSLYWCHLAPWALSGWLPCDGWCYAHGDLSLRSLECVETEG